MRATGIFRTTTLLAFIALATSARAADAQNTCEPKQAANGTPNLSRAWEPTWLVGTWEFTVWVHGAGVPDTVIRGRVFLRPRLLDSANTAYFRSTPIIGHSGLEIEYVPGIEPFRTPVESQSDRHPGVELRIDNTGTRLVFGNPTSIEPTTVVSLGQPYSASFELHEAFTHDFRGSWTLTKSGSNRPRGGYCAVRVAGG